MTSPCCKFHATLGVEQLEDRCTPSTSGPSTHGLLGLYYNNPNLQGEPAAQQVSPTIDVLYKLQNGQVVTETPRMEDGTPVGGYGENNFSVLWEGYLKPSASGYYTFETLSDDGVRLYLGNSPNPAIDAFYPQPPTSHSSQPIHLDAGRLYPIIFEYNETNQGGAEVHLSWEATNKVGKVVVPEEIVPEKNLFAQNAQTPEVTISKATIGSYNKQYEKLQDKDMLAIIKKVLADKFDTTVEKAKDQVALGSVQRSPKDKELLLGNFLYNLQFAAPQAKGSIVQTVTQVVTLYDLANNPIKGSGTPMYQVEGWNVGNNGEALRLDTHQTFDVPMRVGKYSKAEVVVSFRIGDGLFSGKKFQGPYQKTQRTDDKRILDAVTWLGKTRDYQLTFTVYPNGKWTLTDTALKLRLSGEYNKVNK